MVCIYDNVLYFFNNRIIPQFQAMNLVKDKEADPFTQVAHSRHPAILHDSLRGGEQQLMLTLLYFCKSVT